MHISIVLCNKLEHIYYVFRKQPYFLLLLTRKYSKVVFGGEKKVVLWVMDLTQYLHISRKKTQHL